MPRVFAVLAAGLVSLSGGTLPRCAVTPIDAEHVEIVISGPESAYMACGFGATTLDGTYAIVVKANGDVLEDKLGVPFMLGASMEGSELAASVTVSSVETSSGTRTVRLARAMAGASPDHYTFGPGHFPVLRIKGKSAWPSYPAEARSTSLELPAPPPSRRLQATTNTTTAAPSGATAAPSSGPAIGDVSSAPLAISAGAFAVLAATAALMVD